ncbi:leader peptidase (prepilin peptidase) / N-methyltransferase [Streptomyces sp. Ncost-T6T-1]|uniref:prepilin peptidase n=1 Tax=Streptomyces sp. Ncost-T6T-1 TaxID=1100828 RepID=UPI0008058F22|nr:A24 family peptidase [Streptomyces sp. Ncost-T6T-1]SBV03902.1 leader peptidase (prepilin peptidase) / N-methyltransferase [Streptomyces sp. Ncost-T6T-1]
MDAVLLALAAVWGAATGLLIPRAAYRFAVEPEEPWRTVCPAGHPLTGPAGGWLGPARCAPCAAHADPAAQVTQATPAAHADPVPETPAPESQAAPAPEAPAPEPQALPAPEAPAPEPQASAAPEAPAPESQAAPAPPPPATTAPPAYAPGTLAPLVTVLVCVALAAATGARPELVGWLVLAPVAVLLAVVDRRVHRLPDVLTLPLAAAAVLLLGGAALLPGHAGSWTSGLLGGLALGGFYLLLFLINPNGMGFGDVKLALALGVALGWYGWTVLFLGGFAGFLFGAAYGLALVLLRRAGRRTGIPFGPFMAAGALTGVLLGALAG